MSHFIVVWIGQVVSMLGSSMTHFALMFWAWDLTGRATALALMGFFIFLPGVLLSPVAGALVDRLNRKMAMIISDLAAGIGTILILALYLADLLQIYHLYIIGAVMGAFGSMQFPAYSAATTMMVHKRHYARVSGMISMAQAAVGVIAPPLAGFLIYSFATLEQGMTTILSIDICTFVFAIGILLFVTIPQPSKSEEGEKPRTMLDDMAFGFKYIFARKGFMWLALTFMLTNFVFNFAFAVLTPMVLLRTGDNAQLLGIVMAMGGIGGFAGGLLLSVWGGPKRRVVCILVGILIEGLSVILMGFGNASVSVLLVTWSVSFFLNGAMGPIVFGSSQSIWQSKVSPDLQGRVFAARGMLAMMVAPLGLLIGGPLADYVFEPAMGRGGLFTDVFGWFSGTVPGSGMAVMFAIAGFFIITFMIIAYFNRDLRHLEDLPDHNAGGE